MAIVTPGVFSMAALTTEVTTDPKGIGYAGASGNAATIADLMNLAPEPIAAGSQEQIYRTRADSRDLMACLILSEYAAITQANRDYLTMLFSQPLVNTGDANIRTQVASVFGGATTSRANLIAAASKQASRSQALFGDGFSVSAVQVSQALGQ